MLAGFGERHRGFEGGAGFGRLLGLPPVIAAPAGDRDDDENAAGNGEVAVALPQLLQPFAADFFIDFLEYVGHGPVPNTRQKICPKSPQNAAAISLTMWHEQGKDQMPQCFMGNCRPVYGPPSPAKDPERIATSYASRKRCRDPERCGRGLPRRSP